MGQSSLTRGIGAYGNPGNMPNAYVQALPLNADNMANQFQMLETNLWTLSHFLEKNQGNFNDYDAEIDFLKNESLPCNTKVVNFDYTGESNVQNIKSWIDLVRADFGLTVYSWTNAYTAFDQDVMDEYWDAAGYLTAVTLHQRVWFAVWDSSYHPPGYTNPDPGPCIARAGSGATDYSRHRVYVSFDSSTRRSGYKTFLLYTCGFTLGGKTYSHGAPDIYRAGDYADASLETAQTLYNSSGSTVSTIEATVPANNNTTGTTGSYRWVDATTNHPTSGTDEVGYMFKLEDETAPPDNGGGYPEYYRICGEDYYDINSGRTAVNGSRHGQILWQVKA